MNDESFMAITDVLDILLTLEVIEAYPPYAFADEFAIKWGQDGKTW